jgi:PAS domain S-box-containing protein
MRPPRPDNPRPDEHALSLQAEREPREIDAGESGVVPATSRAPTPSSRLVGRSIPQTLWQELIVQLPQAVIVVGADDRVIVANRQACEVVGPERGVLVGRLIGECLSGQHLAEAREVLSGGAPYRYEDVRFTRGIQQVLEVRAELVTTFGSPLLVLLLRDVTAERRMNAEWQQSRSPSSIPPPLTQPEERLHQAQKMEALGQLTGGIVHDFNNLLSIIVGNLELAQRRLAQGAEPIAEVARALQAAERGARLTRRLLAFSRHKRLESWPTDVNELLGGLLDLVRRTLGETIDVSAELDAHLPEVFVDPVQLETALLNLALNSRDAMPEGGRLSVRTSRLALDEKQAATEGIAAGGYVAIEVEDTGCGIPETELANVFEPFYTTKEAGKGSGLGLSMVFGFARQSHGTVRVRSSLGVGTRVVLLLPERPPAELADARSVDA